jgi:hypothetical protein
MYRLREQIYQGICRSGRDAAFRALLSKLAELNLEVHKQDPQNGEIVVECLTLPIYWLLWCGSSDQPLFRFRGGIGSATELVVYTLPSLARIAAREAERATDIPAFMSRLSIEEL